MNSFYLDTSALVKYYIPETGSAWVDELIDAQMYREKWRYEILISQLTVIEVAAAVEKRRRMKEISERHRVRTLSKFSIDARQRYAIVRVSDSIVELAVKLTARHPLRAYDAVQLASALRLNQVMLENDLPPLTFASADETLCKAANAENLAATNPNEINEE